MPDPRFSHDGALRSFEITHIWATEKDLVARRVQFLNYPLTRYRLEVAPEYRSRIFLKFAKETQSLASVPRWYNTAINNCTSSLIKYVNESKPGAIPLHYSYALTGKVDEYLEQLGFKASDYSLHIARDFLESHELGNRPLPPELANFAVPAHRLRAANG